MSPLLLHTLLRAVDVQKEQEGGEDGGPPGYEAYELLLGEVLGRGRALVLYVDDRLGVDLAGGEGGGIALTRVSLN